MEIKCVHCKAQNYRKEGYRKTENRGKIQKYYCKACNKYFTNDNGFYRMRNTPEKITKAIDLYFSNLSSRKVRNQYKRHEDLKISHVSILDWCRRYVLKVQKYTETLEPELSGELYADETEIDCEKRKDIFWCSVDWGTRYINATHYSTTRHKREAVKFLMKAIKNKPEFIQTDAFPLYPSALKSAKWFTDRKMELEHRVNNVSQTGKHNVRIETVFMKIKDRVKDFRGIKALWSAPILMAGIVLQHNYIEEHTTTRKIPCELAGIQEETGCNRWLGLIRLATLSSKF